MDADSQERAQDRWWSGQGQKVLKAFAQSLKSLTQGRTMLKDELSSKVLTQARCMQVYNSMTGIRPEAIIFLDVEFNFGCSFLHFMATV